MRGTGCLRGLLVLGIAFGGSIAPGSVGTGLLGVGPAKAEKFYTRKRVNGQWITGQFPAEDTAPTARPKAKPRRVVRAKPAVAPAATAQQPTLTELVAGATAAASATVPSLSSAIRTEWASVPASALTIPPPAVAPQAAPPAVDLVADERLSRLRSALIARAQDLAARAPDAPASAVAAAPAPAAQPAAGTPEPAKRLEPRSVSYDFETGVKTTVFEDSVVRESFDVASIKRIALPAR